MAQKGFDQGSIDRLLPILNLSGDPMQVLDSIFHMALGNYGIGHGVYELGEILKYLPEEIYKHVAIDFTLARGADYYTGFILEGVLPDISVGAVLGGGRYDNLLAAAGGKEEPAVGMAFGLERIITAMEEIPMFVDDENPTLLLYGTDKHVAVKRAYRLRGLGIMVDFNQNIKGSLEASEYAHKRNYPAFAECNNDGNVVVTPLKEGLHLFFQTLQEATSSFSAA